jgi:hypothetical protein
MWIISLISQTILLASSLSLASAHSRWSCPEPRSPYTDITRGPCGDDTDNFDDLLLATTGDGSVLEISPGPLRVTFEEALSHTGAPFRISLSGECYSSTIFLSKLWLV